MSRLDRRLWIGIAVLSLLAAACSPFSNDASPVIATSTSTSTVNPIPAVTASTFMSSAFDVCNDARKRELAEAFVAAYNSEDIEAVLALWDTPPFDYIDNLDGVEYQAPDEPALLDYLAGRFAANDRIQLTGVEMSTSPRSGAFIISFTRTSAEGSYEGNAKLACEFGGGKLRTMIASSRLIASAEPTPTATVKPYPGVSLPFPTDDGCDVTPMTSWHNRAEYLAAWLNGVGLSAGLHDGLLYEGDNTLLWLAEGSGDLQITAELTDSTSSAFDLTADEATAGDGTPVWTSSLAFASPGCWQISAEQGSNRLDATVRVYPAACRPDAFDPVNCSDPPFVLNWNPERTPPAGCDISAIAGIVTGFIEVLNGGDLEATLAFFPDRDQANDLDTTGLRWFSIQRSVANSPDDLRSVIADLQANGERLRLLRLDVVWGWDGGASLGLVMTRETNELEPHEIEGKAGINCELRQFYVMSAARQDALR